MYAIVKTGGKQYKVVPGEILSVEKLDVEEGKKIELEAICIVDGKKVEADPQKAASTKVEAVVLEQYKGDKQLVFKFKKRKNYKKLRGHRQNLTRIQIATIGSEKAPAKKAAKPAVKAIESQPEVKAAEPAVQTKKTATKGSTEKAPAKKTASKAAPKAAATKSAAAKKPAAKKTETKTSETEEN